MQIPRVRVNICRSEGRKIFTRLHWL